MGYVEYFVISKTIFFIYFFFFIKLCHIKSLFFKNNFNSSSPREHAGSPWEHAFKQQKYIRISGEESLSLVCRFVSSRFDNIILVDDSSYLSCLTCKTNTQPVWSPTSIGSEVNDPFGDPYFNYSDTLAEYNGFIFQNFLMFKIGRLPIRFRASRCSDLRLEPRNCIWFSIFKSHLFRFGFWK